MPFVQPSQPQTQEDGDDVALEKAVKAVARQTQYVAKEVKASAVDAARQAVRAPLILLQFCAYKVGSIVTALKSLGPEEPDDSHPIGFHIAGPGSFAIEIEGEINYQRNLGQICGGRTRDGVNMDVLAKLIPEDSPYCASAVRVEVKGRTVGYLKPAHAIQYRQRLSESGHAGAVASCSAKILGGWKREEDIGLYTLRLDLPAE